MADLIDQIDAVVALGRARMDRADPSIRGLRPAEADWLTSEELERLSELQAEYARSQPTLAELRERVRQKRLARLGIRRPR